MTSSYYFKVEKAFFRGRDSRQERLDLVELSQKHSELIDAAITAYFFFKIDETKHGKKAEHVPFTEFFKNKYQINIDGTVAAYRYSLLPVYVISYTVYNICNLQTAIFAAGKLNSNEARV